MLGAVSTLPHQPQRPTTSGHMVVCGDDTLARRLAVELRYVYGCLLYTSPSPRDS